MQFIMSLNEQRVRVALERETSREVCALLDSTKYKGQTTGSNKVAARRGAADLIENMQITAAQRRS